MFPSAGLQQLPNSRRGGRGLVKLRRAVVPRPFDREGLDSALSPQEGAAVLRAEDVVRRTQDVLLPRQPLQRALLRRAVGDPLLHALAQKALKRGILHRSGGAFDAAVGALAAEAEILHRAEPVQYLDRAAGEALRGGKRAGKRQLQHEIRAAGERRLCARQLVEDGGLPALHEAAAHHADDPRVRAEAGFHGLQLRGVPEVEWVVFANNSDITDFLPV